MAHFTKGPHDGLTAVQRQVAGVFQLLGLIGVIGAVVLGIAIVSGGSDWSIWFAVGLGLFSFMLLAGRWGTDSAAVLDEDAR